MPNTPQTRRRFLAGTAGTALALGLAGCTTGGGSGSEPSPAGETQTEAHGDEEGDHEDEHSDGDDHTTADGHSTADGHHEEETHDDEGAHDEETHQEDDSDGHNHDEGTPEEPAATARVTMRTEGSQHHYDPHIVWVEPGGTVTWERESGQHNAVAYHPDNDDKPLRIPEGAEPWATELLSEPGATASHTFETEGVYDYYCTPHEGVGMVGTVIVGEPDAHDQPALAEPQSSLPEGARRELADLGEQANEALGHTH